MKRQHSSIDAANITPEARTALEKAGFSRRDILKGALIVGFSMGGVHRLGAQGRRTVRPRDVALDQVDSWVAIAQDGSVTAYSGKCDFGQGFGTVQYQLVAEELSVPLNRITLIACGLLGVLPLHAATYQRGGETRRMRLHPKPLA